MKLRIAIGLVAAAATWTPATAQTDPRLVAVVRQAQEGEADSARVAVARAQYDQARARIGRLDIRSPAAGLVLTRNVEAGQVVGPGNGALFRIAQGGEMELHAKLADQDLARISVGSPAEVTPVGVSRSFSGKVWQISPVIDPETRQGVVRISLAFDPALRPGGFAAARRTPPVDAIGLVLPARKSGRATRHRG